MSSHSHYLRRIHPSRESVIEFIRDDSRQKILVRVSAPSAPTVEVLVDPEVWIRFADEVVYHLPETVPPIFLQEGPTCGLYAMKIIEPRLSIEELLRTAKHLGMTAAGEMFCAHDWSRLACQFGLSATVVRVWMIPQLFASGRQGVAAVPYDSDASGISYRKGENAHWCVVWNVWRVGGAEEKLAWMAHSSSPLPMIETWKELEDSNRQLLQATVRVDPHHVHFLEARCLAGFAVWIDRM